MALGLMLLALPVIAAEGILVDGVSAGSAAEKAGVQGGDRIVELDSVPINSLPDLEAVLGNHKAGDKITYQTPRGELKVTLRAIELP